MASGEEKKKRKRHHGIKHNARCTYDMVMNEQNFTVAKKTERKNAGKLHNKDRKENTRKILEELTWDQFKSEVESTSYHVAPYIKWYIKKPNGGERGIFDQTDVKSRLLERMIYQVLGGMCEKVFCNSSYAYREGRSAVTLLKEVQPLAKEGYFAAKLDLSKFFDSLVRKILWKKIQEVIHPDGRLQKLLGLYLTAPRYWDSKTRQIMVMDTGVPQGGVLAPMLANLYVTDLDREMESVKSTKYFRYADDILITGKDVQDVEDALKLLRSRLDSLSLKMNEKKTQKCLLRDLQYLGVRFVGKDAHMLLAPEHIRDKIMEASEESETEKDFAQKFAALLNYCRDISWETLNDPEIDKAVEVEGKKHKSTALEVLHIARSNYKKKQCAPIPTSLWEDVEGAFGDTPVVTDAGEKLAVHISLERPYSENDSESQLAEEESRNGFSKAGSDDGCLELDLSAASNAAKNLLYEIQKQYGKAVVDKASRIVIHLSDNKSLDVVEDRAGNTQVPRIKTIPDKELKPLYMGMAWKDCDKRPLEIGLTDSVYAESGNMAHEAVDENTITAQRAMKTLPSCEQLLVDTGLTSSGCI